jgi:hypothetical protein
MGKRSQYEYMLDTNCIRFIGKHNGGEYGYVEVIQHPFPVRSPVGELIGTVKSLGDTLPLILEHNEKLYSEHRRRELDREKAALKPDRIICRLALIV